MFVVSVSDIFVLNQRSFVSHPITETRQIDKKSEACSVVGHKGHMLLKDQIRGGGIWFCPDENISAPANSLKKRNLPLMKQVWRFWFYFIENKIIKISWTLLWKTCCQSFKIVPTLALTVTIKSVKVGGMNWLKKIC